MGGVPLNENPIPGFPFSAVHGQDEAKLALVLNAVDPRIGGVLLRGEKGSAKSTLARGLAALLDRAAPFVELPVGATEDRVVGTLDLEAALTEGRRRLHPGLLAAADGGVLYVDEVNLLPDHLVDVLLDVAASGVNRVEREGMAASHPARFVLVGSMNPEEGELRPQLLDRFGLSVDVAAPRDPLARAEAVRRRLDFDADAGEVARRFAPAQRELAERLAAARPAAPGHELIASVTRLCAEVGAEGLRADLVICRAAAALAAWEGRGAPDLDDVRKVAPLALAHRRRRSPFEAPGIDDDEIDEALHAAQRGRSPGGPGPGLPQEDPGENRSPGGPGPGVERREQDGPEGGVPGEQDGPEGGGDPAPPGPTSRVVRLDATDRRPPGEAASGRRSLTQGRRGRLVGDRIPDGRVGDVAVGATVRAAAGRRALAGGAGPEALVSAADLREARREQRSANLLVLTVDASASMGVEQRMEAVKGAAISILLDAYQRRDRVALVTFAGEAAETVLRPTSSVEVARARLGALRTGGRTPLASGIEAALELAAAGPDSHRPLLVLVTDGRATAAEGGRDPFEAALQAAGDVARRKVPAVVIDVEEGATRLGLAAAVAESMGARLVTLPELTAGSLTGALRGMVGR